MYRAAAKRSNSGKPRLYRGKRVLDSRAPLHFLVTEADCKVAKPNDPSHCAGAEALRRSLPDVLDVYVHRSVVFLEYPQRVVRFKTSQPVRDQLLRFDAAGAFDPGKYSLKAVTKKEIESRGVKHSPPDRPHGAKDSPYKRKAPVRNLGRADFHFD